MSPKATPLTSLPGLVGIEYKVLLEATGHFDKTPLDSGGHKLGEGGFGEVFHCKLDISGERIEVAVKVLRNKVSVIIMGMHGYTSCNVMFVYF